MFGGNVLTDVFELETAVVAAEVAGQRVDEFPQWWVNVEEELP